MMLLSRTKLSWFLCAPVHCGSNKSLMPRENWLVYFKLLAGLNLHCHAIAQRPHQFLLNESGVSRFKRISAMMQITSFVLQSRYDHRKPARSFPQKLPDCCFSLVRKPELWRYSGVRTVQWSGLTFFCSCLYHSGSNPCFHLSTTFWSW